MRQYCRVTADGIAHLFVGLDFGSACACGRKVYGFALDTEEPTLLDMLRARPEGAVMAKKKYTDEDLEEAKQALQRLKDAWANYSGNNPDKYQRQIRSAREKVRLIEYELKLERERPE